MFFRPTTSTSPELAPLLVLLIPFCGVPLFFTNQANILTFCWGPNSRLVAQRQPECPTGGAQPAAPPGLDAAGAGAAGQEEPWLHAEPKVLGTFLWLKSIVLYALVGFRDNYWKLFPCWLQRKSITTGNCSLVGCKGNLLLLEIVPLLVVKEIYYCWKLFPCRLQRKSITTGNCSLVGFRGNLSLLEIVPLLVVKGTYHYWKLFVCWLQRESIIAGNCSLVDCKGNLSLLEIVPLLVLEGIYHYWKLFPGWL